MLENDARLKKQSLKRKGNIQVISFYQVLETVDESCWESYSEDELVQSAPVSKKPKHPISPDQSGSNASGTTSSGKGVKKQPKDQKSIMSFFAKK